MTRHEPALAAPGFLRHRLVWAFLMVLFLFPFFIHIPRELNHHPVISPLGDQVHIVLFGGITLLLYWFGPLRGRLGWAATAGAVMGGAVEFLQLLVGRQALFKDFLLDLVGIGIVVGFILWKGHGRQVGKWLFLLLLLSIPFQLWYLPWRIDAAYRARDQFPVLADFETWGDRFLWSNNMKSEVSFHQVADSPDGEGGVLRLATDGATDWPGATMRRFPEDWSDYTEILFDVRVIDAPGDTLKFGLRLDDYEGVKEMVWVSQTYAATSEWQTFTMDIADRQLWNSDRHLNLAEMDRFHFFFRRPETPLAIEVDNIRLQ